MSRLSTRIGVVLTSAGLLFGSLAIFAPAADAHTICVAHRETRIRAHHPRHGSYRPFAARGDLFTHMCTTSRPGPDLKWEKPVALWGRYSADLKWYNNVYYCLGQAGIGIMTDVVVSVHIWNPETGYNANRSVRIDCHDSGRGFSTVGMADKPRCYTPWIPNGGRAPGGHYALCKFSMHAEAVNVGPAPNITLPIGRGWIA